MNILITLLLLLIFSSFSLFLFSWYQLRRVITAPSDPDERTPADYKLKYHPRKFITSDGITLKGWYISVQNPKAILVVPHSYMYTKTTLLTHAKYLHQNGYSTFFIDLRSDGKKSRYTFGVQEWKDAEGAYDYMKSLPENKNKKIGFYSGSMGGVLSIIAAGKTGKGDFLIISVPYANFKNLFSFGLRIKKLPRFLLPFIHLAALIEFGLNYHHYVADRHIVHINKPIFLMAAKNDLTVDHNDTKQLFNLANEPKTFWEADARHDIMIDKPEELKKRVLEFLKKHV